MTEKDNIKLCLVQISKEILLLNSKLLELVELLLQDIEEVEEVEEVGEVGEIEEIEEVEEVKNSVLIGCDYENSSSELKGCSFDILKMRELLIDKSYSTVVFCDDDDRNLKNIDGLPTYANITNMFDKTLDQISGKFVFHYSGHGSSARDKNDDENDNKDELIITTDMFAITDDYLNKNFFSKFNNNIKVLALMDCCFSGSILDLKYRLDNNNKEIIENDIDIKADIICISGCTDNQTSADAYINSDWAGAMTSSFLYTYNKIGFQNITVKDFVECMRKWLKENKYEQIPQLTYSKPNAYNNLISLYV